MKFSIQGLQITQGHRSEMQESGMGTTANTVQKNKLPFHMPCNYCSRERGKVLDLKLSLLTPENRQLELLGRGSAHMILEIWQATLKAENAEANHTHII